MIICNKTKSKLYNKRGKPITSTQLERETKVQQRNKQNCPFYQSH